MANPDIKLIFGVEGGSTVSGESGKIIARDLNKIAKQIRPKITLDIDCNATQRNFQSQLQRVVNGVKLQPVKVNFSVANTSTQRSAANAETSKTANISATKLLSIDQDIKKFDQLKIKSAELVAALNELQKRRAALGNSVDGISKDPATLKAYQEQYQLVNKLVNSEKLLQAERNKSNVASIRQANSNQKLAEMENKNTILAQKKMIELQKFQQNLKPSAVNLTMGGYNARQVQELLYQASVKKTAQSIKDATHAMDSYTTAQRSAANAGKNLFTLLDSKMKSFAAYAISAALTMGIWKEFRSGIQVIKDMDNALTTINMTMTLTENQLKDLGIKSVQMAKDMGISVKEIMGATQIYANMNTSLDKILEKARPTALLSGASGMSTSSSADLIQGALYQFNMEDTEDNLMRIVDVVEKISASTGVEFGRSIQEISEGIKTNGSMAKSAGYDLETYAASIASLVERTRKSGSEIANAQKMIFSRLGQARGTDQGASDEDISKAETAYKSLGIEIRKTKDEFEAVPIILDKLGGKWDKLTSVQKANIAEVSAGNRNRSIFIAMMDNYANQVSLTTDALNSNGFAEEANIKRMESFAAKQEQIKATMAGLWNDAINTSLIKTGMDLLMGFLNLFNGLPAKVLAISAATFILVSAFNALKVSSIGVGVIATFSSLTSVVQKFNVILLATQDIERALAAQQMITNGITVNRAMAMSGASAGTMQFVISNNIATASELTFAQSVRLGSKALLARAATLAATPLGMIALATTASFAIFKISEALTVSFEEQTEIVNTLTTEVNSLKDEYETLLNTENRSDQQNNRLNLLKAEIDLQNELLSIEKEKQYQMEFTPKKINTGTVNGEGVITVDKSQEIQDNIDAYNKLNKTTGTTLEQENELREEQFNLQKSLVESAKKLNYYADDTNVLTDADKALLKSLNELIPTFKGLGEVSKDSLPSPISTDYLGSFKTLSDSLADLDKAFQSLVTGEGLGAKEIAELVEKYPELARAIETENGILSLNKDMVSDLMSAKSLAFREEMEMKAVELEAEINKADLEIQSLESLMSARQFAIDNILDLAGISTESMQIMGDAGIQMGLNITEGLEKSKTAMQAFAGVTVDAEGAVGSSFDALKDKLLSAQENQKNMKESLSGLRAILNTKSFVDGTSKHEEEKSKKQDDYNKKEIDTNKKISEINRANSLEIFKKSLDDKKLLIDQFNSKIELMDVQLSLTDESDYTGKVSLLNEKYDLTLLKSKALYNEFEKLSTIKYANADEAQAVADRIAQVGQDMRNNLKDVVSLNKEIMMTNVSAIDGSISNRVEQYSREINLLDNTLAVIQNKASGRKSLFGDDAFGFAYMLPKIPQSALTEKRKENDRLISEQEHHQETIEKIVADSLDIQLKENQKARDEEKAELIRDLGEAKKELTKSVNELNQIIDNGYKTGIENAKKNAITAPEVDVADWESKGKEIAEALNSGLSRYLEPLDPKQIWMKDENKDTKNYSDKISGQVAGSSYMKNYNGMRVTQKPYDNYSHKGANATDYAPNYEAGQTATEPIISPVKGKVINIVYDDKYAGNYISISDGTNKHNFLHLSAIGVKKGESISKGQVIGNMGNTGNSTGPHLHYEIKKLATGTKGTTQEEVLVGEEGKELATLPDGTKKLLGENGAELARLPIGTHIYNNKDTEEILKYTGDNSVNTPVKKYASGTESAQVSSVFEELLEKIEKFVSREFIDKIVQNLKLLTPKVEITNEQRLSQIDTIMEENNPSQMYSDEFMKAYLNHSKNKIDDRKKLNELEQLSLDLTNEKLNTEKIMADIRETRTEIYNDDIEQALKMEEDSATTLYNFLKAKRDELIKGYANYAKDVEADPSKKSVEVELKYISSFESLEDGMLEAEQRIQDVQIARHDEFVQKKLALDEEWIEERKFHGELELSDEINKLNKMLEFCKESYKQKMMTDEEYYAYYKEYSHRIIDLEKEKTEKIYKGMQQAAINYYDSQIKALEKTSKLKDEEIEQLQEILELLEEKKSKYDKTISAVVSVVDDEIDKLNDQKKALQEANKEQEKKIELAELEENLRAARENKVNRVYHEGKGFVFEADTSAIDDAQKALNDFKLNAQIDAIDKKIESWNEYKSQWTDIVDNIEKEQNKLIAAEVLGQDWEQAILDQRQDKVEDFANKYSVLNDRIENDVKRQIATLEKEKKELQKNIDSQKEILQDLKDKWASALDIEEDIIKYEGSLEALLGAENSSYEERLEAIHRFVDKYNDEIDRIESSSEVPSPKMRVNGGSYKNSIGSAIGSIGNAIGNAIGSLIPRKASGTRYTTTEGLTNVDELGEELILKNPNQGRYTILEKGDGVLPANLTDRIFQLANNPTEYIMKGLNNIQTPEIKPQIVQPSITFTGNLSFPGITGVNDAEMFARQFNGIVNKALQRSFKK